MVLSAGYPLLVLQIVALLRLISWLLNELERKRPLNFSVQFKLYLHAVRYSRAGL